MRGRPRSKETPFRVHLQTKGSYRYAVTEPTVYNPVSGKPIRRYVYWGTVSEDLVFEPNSRFILATKAERDKLIFPPEWSTAEAFEATEGTLADSEIPTLSQDYSTLLFGSSWLLWAIAEQQEVTQDLEEVFCNPQIVEDILTLAIFPIIYKYNYDRLERCQGVCWFPSQHLLSSKYITLLTQRITDAQRMNFLKLRAERENSRGLLAVDSTTRSAWGKCLADIRWGVNKDNPLLQNTIEVVCYSLSEHTPVYYRTFAGNEADKSTLGAILKDLSELGCADLTLVFDRGYQSEDNLRKMIEAGYPFLMCSKIGQEPVYGNLSLIKWGPDGIPSNLEFIPKEKIYCGQFKRKKTFELQDGSKKTVTLQINIFVDTVKRAAGLNNIQSRVALEEERLKTLAGEKERPSAETLNRQLRYFKVSEDEKGTLDWKSKTNLLEKDIAGAGIFSSISYKTPGDAAKQLENYEMRWEQEQYFESMKDQMGFYTQRNGSEEGKRGRSFILFVGLILLSRLRHVWREKLREKHRTYLDLLDILMPVKRSTFPDGTSFITSFTEEQANIAQACEVKIPEGCLSTNQKLVLQRKKLDRKRGRPKGSLNKPKVSEPQEF